LTRSKHLVRSSVTLLAGWLSAEAVHALAARAVLPARRPAPGERGLAVVVLGYHNEDPAAINWLNRWRADVVMRSIPRDGQAPLIVASGGSRRPGLSEAALLANYLVDRHGVAPERVVVEEVSLSTWENIANVRPLLAAVDQVMIVSNPLHALKARWYLRRQDPALAARLVPAQDYRLGELAWAKPALAAYGLRDLAIAALGLWRRPAGIPPRVDARGAARRAVPVTGPGGEPPLR